MTLVFAMFSHEGGYLIAIEMFVESSGMQLQKLGESSGVPDPWRG